MDNSTTDEKNVSTGFHNSKKPFHLEKRFQRSLHISPTLHKNSQAVESKREAILQERRNKLNQNFLKVKRIVKEMEHKRQHKQSSLSKSMKLAEQNRNKHIEQRRILSKRTVERAKCVALENQIKSEREQERRRAELESRLIETEARRLAHLKNRLEKKKKQINNHSTTPGVTSASCSNNTTNLPMSVSVAQQNSSIPTIIEAAVVTALPSTAVEKKKPSSWSVILKAFRGLGLPLLSKPDTWLEFNQLGKLLHQPKVVVVTTKVLNAALKLIDNDSRRRARILLTSYMTVMCPREVLQNVNGTEEKRLLSSGKHMLQLFEIWLSAHGRPGATVARLGFVSAWDDYNILFEVWKARDCEHLIQNMIGYYVELSTLRQIMLAGDNGQDDVEDQLKQQLDQIKSKLEKLGQNEALNALQRALELSAASTSTGRKRQQQNNTPRSPLPTGNGSNRVEVEQDEEESNSVTNTTPEQMGQLLNPYTRPSLSNAQLSHELIMDPEFKLTRYEATNKMEAQIRAIAEKAFFDKMVQDIQENKAQDSLTLLVSDVKNRLLALVRSGTSLYNQINEAIDISLVEQELHNNSFDMTRMIRYVLDCMANMCAPVRDEQIQHIREQLSDQPIEQIKLMLPLLEDMGLDLANFRLRSLRPHLMSMAVEYEHNTFKAQLDTDQVTLERTTSWLTKSVSKLCKSAARRNPEGVAPEINNKPTHDAIFEDAFVSLLTQPQSILSDPLQLLPETLATLDLKRMADFQNQVQAITIVAALLMLARNFASASNHQLSDLSTRLFALLEAPDTSIDHLAAEIEQRSAVHLRPERRETIRNMVDKTVSHSDTIYSLLCRRVGLVIRSTIANNTFVTDAVLSSNGLEHVKNQLQQVSHQILRMTQHHRKVHAEWYSAIIAQGLKEQVVSSSSNTNSDSTSGSSSNSK